MLQHNNPAAVPSLAEAQNALAQLATQDALTHLEAALRSLEGLSASLQSGDRLQPAEQRELERSLLRFRAELRDAGILAESGLAYCQDWVQQLQPPSMYQPNGGFTNTSVDRHELSLDA
jgi:hypothetical protein